ncbi:hypothetical protein [Kribbella sp. HUAS MG21]|uniref:Uncharacterized protein n=1 Tax=Kribbella sp. HUAS MG21 TaxID=3160966 RepID=A0AAU7TD58_9ACTN
MTGRPNVWGGSSGAAFAARVQGVVNDSGRTADVDVTPVGEHVATPGAFLVEVSVHDGPQLLYEVADWLPGARIMDPDGEDLTLDQALRYLELRIMGLPPSEALKEC